MQRIKEFVRMYLEPRGLYDLCIFKSILLLCGFEEARGAHNKHLENEAIQAHKSILGGLLQLKSCKSWEQSFFRFFLVAICPCRFLCFKFLKHFMHLPLLRPLTIERVYLRARKLHRESLQSDRGLMMSNNNSQPQMCQSAVSAFRGKSLLYREWWDASYSGEQRSYTETSFGRITSNLAYMGYLLVLLRLRKQWGDRGDHEEVSLTEADLTFVYKEPSGFVTTQNFLSEGLPEWILQHWWIHRTLGFCTSFTRALLQHEIAGARPDIFFACNKTAECHHYCCAWPWSAQSSDRVSQDCLQWYHSTEYGCDWHSPEIKIQSVHIISPARIAGHRPG